ncbi:MAG: cyclic nucleotide-binding domain-containing protein [Desulfobacter sp.]|nr:cyclic nucleotide-binding domain-containing protein [Desulfobacter sp.]WDP86393.1 MAG: cyclic nucleotide-binding domain-containing protein [Desulfobacter sp.]
MNAEKYAKYAQILEKTKWANEFSWNHIKKICLYIDPVMAKPGAIVFKEGEMDKSLGIIVKGAIDIIKENTKVTTLKSSQTFGEMSLIDGEPRSASGIAAKETIIFFMREEHLIQLTEDDPKLGVQLLWKISKLISQRLRNTTGKLVDYMGDSPG